MSRQLALPVGLSDHAQFDTFLDAGNAEAGAAMRQLAAGDGPSPVWLCGPRGSGKSHLLQAACAAARGAVSYLPLGRLSSHGPGLLEGLERCRLVCIDDVHAVAGEDAWERALFALYNALHDAGGALVLAAPRPPGGVGIALADLASRLAAARVYGLQPLDEARLLVALQNRAARRGFDLPDETGRWMLRRLPRDAATLFELLDRLDLAALAAQRRLTVPFVRETLAAVRPDAQDCAD